MVRLGPLAPADPRTGRAWTQVAVPLATNDDLAWLNTHAEWCGGRIRFVRAGSREDRAWIKMVQIRG